MTALRFDTLSLTNFRCFARCEIEFHPFLTVLVAENGSGKSAVLDAVASALSVFVNALYPLEKIRKIDRTDVRLIPGPDRSMIPCVPTAYEAQATIQNEVVHWQSSAKTYSKHVRSSTRHFRQMRTAAQPFLTAGAILPLIAYYGTGRLWNGQRRIESRRASVSDVNERVTAYADCLASSSSFKGISSWFEQRALQTATPAYKESLAVNLAMIGGVKYATDTVLEPTGWSNLDWDNAFNALSAEHDNYGRLPMSLLSDGVRNMLALVADVARRCTSLNPQLGHQASRHTPGVLIVDEVDMHLHPRWQQQVLDLLQRAFPALQIIVSTHSPHVLSTVEKSSIRVLHVDNGDAVIGTPTMQTRGVESANVLASVMDVDPVPDVEESNLLSRYRALIEDGLAEAPEASGLRQTLTLHFGATHPVLLECDRLIRFQRFRVGKPERDGA